MKLLHSKNNAGLLQQLQHIFEGGADLQEFINNLLEFLRIVLLRKIGMSPEEVTSEEYPAYDEIASLFSQENLLYMMSMLMQTRTELKSSGNPYLIFELVMIKLCKLDEMEDLGEVIARLKSQPLTKVVPQTPKQPVSKGVTTPVNIESKPDIIPSAEPEPIDKKELTQENLTELWDKIVARVIQIGRMAGLALKEANFKVSSGFKIIIQLSRKSSLDAVQGKKEDIEQIIGEYFQTQPRLELELISGNTVDSIVIPHKTLEDLKKMDENLARYIEITDSKLIS
jgi:DNA polymerase-3 subunit gamma/tau